jgi:hypothetical protein
LIVKRLSANMSVDGWREQKVKDRKFGVAKIPEKNLYDCEIDQFWVRC